MAKVKGEVALYLCLFPYLYLLLDHAPEYLAFAF
jgi:hypothetical protein